MAIPLCLSMIFVLTPGAWAYEKHLSECHADDCQVSLVQTFQGLKTRRAGSLSPLELTQAPPSHFWPHPRGRVGKYAQTYDMPADVNLSAALAWNWTHPDGIDSLIWGSLIDDQKNLYITGAGSSGTIKLSPDGQQLWRSTHGGENSVLDGPALYGMHQTSALMFALDIETGKELWTKRISDTTGLQGDMVEAYRGVVIAGVGRIDMPGDGGVPSRQVMAVNASTGDELWTFEPTCGMWNVDAMFPDTESTMIMDLCGGAYRLGLYNGSLLWGRSGSANSFTDGGATLDSEGDMYTCTPLHDLLRTPAMTTEARSQSNLVVEAAAAQEVLESSSKASHDPTLAASTGAPGDSSTSPSCAMEPPTNTQASSIRQSLIEVLGPHPAGARNLPPVGPPRSGLLTATPEDHSALAGLMADAVSARLAEDVRVAVAPLLREQAAHFRQALDRVSKAFGPSAGSSSSSTVNQMFMTDPSGVTNASTRMQQSSFDAVVRTHTFDQKPTATNGQTPTSIVPSVRRANEDGGQTDAEKMRSVERRGSLAKRLACWTNRLTTSGTGAEARQPSGLESIADARGSQLLATMTDHDSGFYKIVLGHPRECGQRIGIDVTREGRTFIITAIHPDGLFAAWNAENKDRQVAIGDRIIEVNGSPEKVLETLVTGKCPRVRLQRGPRASGPVARIDEDKALEAPTDSLASGHCSDGIEGSGRGHSDSAQPVSWAARRSPDAEVPRGIFSLDSASAPARKCAGGAESAPLPGATAHVGSDSEDLVSGPSGQSVFGADVRSSTKVSSISGRNPTVSTADKDQPASRTAGRRSAYQSATTTLRIEREEELLSTLSDLSNAKDSTSSQEATSSQLRHLAAAVGCWSHERKVQSPLLLCICGILPWQSAASAFYRPAVVLLAAGCTVVFACDLRNNQSVAFEDMDCQADICLNFQHLCDLVLAVGSFLGLLAARTLSSSKLLGSNKCLLIAYARRQDVVGKWSSAVNWQTLSLFILWACSLAFRLAMVHPLHSGREALSTVAFALASVIFTGIIYGILHVSCAIAIMIDSYCQHLSHDPNLARGVQEWNILQALLRKASRALERSFLVLQTTALAMVLISASSLFLHGTSDFWWPLSNLLLSLSVGLNFFKAADVTEKCTRVPSLVNSLEFSGDISLDRHYLVEYVTYSRAGFYVGEVRLTAGMALKFTYISGVFAFAVLTKLTGMG